MFSTVLKGTFCLFLLGLFRPVTPVYGDGGLVGIAVKPLSDVTVVSLIGTDPIRYRDFFLESPPRIVVDLPGTRNDLPRKQYLNLNRGGVRSIRTSQKDTGLSRVVIDVKEKTAYSISEDKNTLRVVFKNPETDFEAWSVNNGNGGGREVVLARSTETVRKKMSTTRVHKERRRVSGKVGYISGNAVYIDVGRVSGLAAGDTVRVVRGGRTIGSMVVLSTASNASSCRPFFPITDVRVGDRVVTVAELITEVEEEVPEPVASTPRKRTRGENRLRGRISLGSLLSEDLTSSGLDFSQPSLSARFAVDNIAGAPISLRMRHRSRYLGRETRLGGETSDDRWTHKVFELFLSYEDDGWPYRISVGRLLPSMPRGLGYIDGVMIEYKKEEYLTYGVTGGTRPDVLNAGYQSEEKTFGLFTVYERANEGGGDRSLSAAFTGSYRSGSINREYFYFEGNYSTGGKFSTSNNVEIELNRGWKHSGGRRLFELTSLYLTARYRLSSDLNLNLSYDTRKSPRSLDNDSVPDSLFDDSFRKGLHSGVSWRMSRRVHISGSVGARFMDGRDNTLSTSGATRVSDFPWNGVHTNFRLSLFRGMFSKGYRPMVNFGLSPVKGLIVNVRGGDTVYDVQGEVDHNPWVGSSLYYRLSRWSFFAASFTGYVSERLRSAQLFAETGLLF